MNCITEFDEHIDRLNNMFKYDVLLNCFNDYAKYEIKNIDERKTFKQYADKWMKRIKFNSYRFPFCVLDSWNFVKLMKDIGILFPITLYTDYDNIKVIGHVKANSETVKAYKCYITFIDWLLPIKLKMNLLYIPHRSKLLKITFTGNKTERFLTTEMKNNNTTTTTSPTSISDCVKCLPFNFVKLIISGCKANDDEYVRAWIETIYNNIMIH